MTFWILGNSDIFVFSNLKNHMLLKKFLKVITFLLVKLGTFILKFVNMQFSSYLNIMSEYKNLVIFYYLI